MNRACWLLPERENKMSYILEALKKSQAERQLGHAPTIHAVQLDVAGHAPVRRAGVGMWAMAVLTVVVVAAAVLWSRRDTSAPVVVVAAAPVAAAPAAVPAPPVRVEFPAAPPKAPAKPPAPKPVAAPVAVPAAAPDDNVRALHELPEATQRELPQVSFGGYMYSNNPADRLVLVDKVLRHEGEQVAPGLVLERLLPKGAVMNYRGTRYKVQF
jgi:general secretion pathway protein B